MLKRKAVLIAVILLLISAALFSVYHFQYYFIGMSSAPVDALENKDTGIPDYEHPQLATEKNNKEQIRMCSEAYHSENWKTILE